MHCFNWGIPKQEAYEKLYNEVIAVGRLSKSTGEPCLGLPYSNQMDPAPAYHGAAESVGAATPTCTMRAWSTPAAPTYLKTMPSSSRGMKS